jgi:hypothetical protein
MSIKSLRKYVMCLKYDWLLRARKTVTANTQVLWLVVSLVPFNSNNNHNNSSKRQMIGIPVDE